MTFVMHEKSKVQKNCIMFNAIFKTKIPEGMRMQESDRNYYELQTLNRLPLVANEGQSGKIKSKRC